MTRGPRFRRSAAGFTLIELMVSVAIIGVLASIAEGDRLFFMVIAMTVTGLVTLLTWDGLYPDRKDYLNLLPLPVRPRDDFLAKLAGVAQVLLGFFLAANGIPGVLAPLLWVDHAGGSWPFRPILAFLLASLAASAFVFFSLAGLQGIPESLYEAAKVDGASSFQVFWFVTLPLLAPVTLYVLVTSIIGSFQIFGPIYAMTGGGPAFATTTIVHQIYINGFRYFNMGYASAQSWVLFVLLLGLSIINLRLMVGGMEAQ